MALQELKIKLNSNDEHMVEISRDGSIYAMVHIDWIGDILSGEDTGKIVSRIGQGKEIDVVLVAHDSLSDETKESLR